MSARNHKPGRETRSLRGAQRLSVRGLQVAPVCFVVAYVATGCGTILGVDDFSVDPSFGSEDASTQGEPEPEAPRPSFVTDDDSDDDVADDDSDDDVADDDSDDDVADDDSDDDVADDDVVAPEAGIDDDSDDDVVAPEAGIDDDVADDDVADDDSDDDVADDDSDDDVADDDVTENCFAPVSGSCDTAPQCGCGEDNCEFDLDNSGATSCVASGDTVPYGECTGTSAECPAGYSCVAGLCKAFCSGDEPVCEQGAFATCHEVTDGSQSIPGFFVCARTCDPRDPTNDVGGFLPCGPDVACLPAGDGTSNCYVPTTPGTAGSDCTGVSGTPDPFLCAPGLGCLDGTPPTCQPFCEVGSDDCGPGAECVATTPASYAGTLEMGTCFSCPDVPTGDECTHFPQCGCAPGQMCYDGQCVTEGTIGLNEDCAANELCGAGLDCIVYGTNPVGVCTAFCSEAADCPNPNALCFEGLTFPICLWGCDPRDPTNDAVPFNACGADQICVPGVAGDSACTPGMIAGNEGEYCYTHDECGPGLGCDYATYACTPWCHVGALDCASASASCFEDPYATSAGETFGFCQEAIVTVSSTDTPTAITDQATTQSVISVPYESYYNYTFLRVTVEVVFTHSYFGDLTLALLAPDGTTIPLATAPALSGSGAVTLRFDDSGAALASPYQGAYRPETALDTLSGLPLTGDWTLVVTDSVALDSGTLTSWRLHFW